MMQFYLYLVEIDNIRSKRGYYAFQTVETSETAAIFGRNVAVKQRTEAKLRVLERESQQAQRLKEVEEERLSRVAAEERKKEKQSQQRLLVNLAPHSSTLLLAAVCALISVGADLRKKRGGGARRRRGLYGWRKRRVAT